MLINLVNPNDFNAYLTNIICRGQDMPALKIEDFKSPAFIQQNKEVIIRSMLLQWCKYCIRSYLTEHLSEYENTLTPIAKNESDLPKWAKFALDNDEPVYRFEAKMLSPIFTDALNLVCDYLHQIASAYINKKLTIFKNTTSKGKKDACLHLCIDYLKSQEFYKSYINTLSKAVEWKKNNSLKNVIDEQDRASLQGTLHVMDFADGMSIVQLTSPEALAYEGKYMNHCIGGDGYAKVISNDTIKIYSLRDKNDKPHVTFTVSLNEETQKNEITECSGKGNKPPITKYCSYLRKFIKAKKLDISKGEEIYVGLIKLYDEETKKSLYYSLFNVPKNRKFTYYGDLYLEQMQLTELPDLSNVTIKGDFSCSQNELTKLKGAPLKVTGAFDCSCNPLPSLQGVSPCTEVNCFSTLTSKYNFKRRTVAYDELITNKEFLREKNLQIMSKGCSAKLMR